ncbi:MAG: hypothetical protein BWY06_03129 [Candidatus Latescibacteria bacterium ADurb.Bin168]|nr:MAG: hypothetical protein BWY06_03129 [Candidatus Latescibacteria bacterium ADurb.Bin168]
MPDIEVAGGLIPGVVNTPLDARTRQIALADIPNIPNPAVGMHIYILETGREYIVKTLKAKTVGGIEVADRQIDSYELIPGKADLDAKADATTWQIARPISNDGLHLIVLKAGENGSRSGAATIIDTLNVAADRARVKGYLDSGTDGAWNVCPAEGFGSAYDDAPVSVNLSGLVSGPAILYYCWAVDASTRSDWYSVVFPSSGEAQANSGLGNIEAALAAILGE